MTFKEKKAIYGRCRVAVGGSLGAPGGSDGADGSGDDDEEPDGGGEDAPQLRAAGLGRGKDTGRRDDTVEPLCFQQLPKVLYQELLHTCAAKAVYDLTVGDGTFLLACVERKVPCVGLCYTEEHVSQLYKHLQEEVFKLFQLEDSPLYEPTLAVIVGRKAAGAPAEPAGPAVGGAVPVTPAVTRPASSGHGTPPPQLALPGLPATPVADTRSAATPRTKAPGPPAGTRGKGRTSTAAGSAPTQTAQSKRAKKPTKRSGARKAKTMADVNDDNGGGVGVLDDDDISGEDSGSSD
ncbi:MAG: hypothetical protein GY772_11200 [bacterium]|nr:hypothetical protein [bacterium]